MHPLLRFRDETLLQQALTHDSYANEHPGEQDNERLEFLGDAVLNFLSGEYLYERFSNLKEGELTRYRAALVDEAQLAQFAIAIGLADRMRLGEGESETGRQKARLLSSTFEAVVGAYYLDRQKQLRMLRPHIHNLFDGVPFRVLSSRADKHPKSRLQELAQLKFGTLPQYVPKRIGGTDHEPLYRARVYIGEQVFGEGRGGSKEAANTQAAEDALKRIEDGLP
ncbi:ribonuclease III [Leptolyngbya sp. FACHB-711]|jgi:ribonuclease-3|uniref:ribonuclease III n=1 Tax=Leptolyngbya sp. FACHB-711 TaxID=2692813 RepID=UPI0016876DF9|nr:ribonuclease III [Leptolyngbya sp. FACHB-711]MBD1851795.1 ribonuclease III [Cyanobacteria bacterium FACHB-502]MBD2026123.1 ribonuclease III [Leptolyngbya sp. FACHB-711]